MSPLADGLELDEHPREVLLARPLDRDRDAGPPLFPDHIRRVAASMVDGPHAGGVPGWLQHYIGAFHDLGKATAYFQEYIRGERDRSDWTHHSALGGLAAFYALDHAPEIDATPVEHVLAWYVITRHHGLMINLADCYGRVFDPDRLPIYHEQARALEPYAAMIEDAYAEIGIPFDVPGFVEWVTSNQMYQDVRGALDFHGSVDPDDLPPDSAYQVIDAYGRLISADRLDASGLLPPDRCELPAGMVEQYVADAFDRPAPGSINALREAGRQTVEQALWDAWGDGRRGPARYTISLPTGAGKTLTGVHAALWLRERITETEVGDAPRIIYALPYTAIIDQVAAELETVLETAGQPTDPTTLLKHHYLSPGYHATDDDEYSHRERSMLTDRWDAEIVVTTYVQLLEGLLTPTPSQALRWAAMSPAIIVLDEPQSIPSPYWTLVDETLTWITEEWDVRTISMTATHPRISDDDADQPRAFAGGEPLIPHPERFHDRLDRVRFRIDQSVGGMGRALPVDQWTRRGIEYAIEHPDDDVLLIVNTLRAAEQVHDQIAGAVDRSEIEGRVRYLSSNVRPVDRARRIAELTDDDADDLDRGEREIIVSTQVVETGVDLDVDYLLRDFAPADTIVQAAGRCNRNSTHGESRVDVVRMAGLSSHADPPSEQVYDDTKLDMTQRVLAGAASTVSEPVMVDELLPAYFDRLAAQPGLDHGRDQIQRWRFDAGAISLIDDPDGYQFFIALDDRDCDVLTAFTDALEDGDRAELERTKAAAYERVVSLRDSQVPAALRGAIDDPGQPDVRLLDDDRELVVLEGAAADQWYVDPIGLRVA